MPAPPPIPNGVGMTLAPPASGGAAPPIPDLSAPKAGPKPPPIPVGVGTQIGSTPSKPGPSLTRDVGAGTVKGVENLGHIVGAVADFMLHPVQSFYHDVAQSTGAEKPTPNPVNQAMDKAVTQAVPATKQVAKWAADTHPQGILGAAAQGAGEAIPLAAGFALPGSGEDEIASAGAAALGKLRSLAGLGAMGAASGAGQKVGEGLGRDVAGQQGAEIGGTLGAIVGGFTPATIGYGLTKAGTGLMDAVPMTQAAKNRWALRNLQHFEPDIASVRANVKAPAAPLKVGPDIVERSPSGEIVPGSVPTVAQLSGSQKLARLGEGLKTSDAGAPLLEAESAQGAARAQSLRDIGPGGPANPSAVSAHLRGQFAKQDAVAAQAENAARASRETAVQAQPGANGATTPFQAGKQIQDTLAQGDARRQAATSALYDKLTERNPVVNMTPLADTVNSIRGEVVANKGELSAPENKILDRAQDLAESKDTTWGQVNQLRADLNSEIDVSLGPLGQRTPATRRLTMLKSGLDASLADAAAKAVEADPEYRKEVAAAEFPAQTGPHGAAGGREAGDGASDNEGDGGSPAGGPLSPGDLGEGHPGSGGQDGGAGRHASGQRDATAPAGAAVGADAEAEQRTQGTVGADEPPLSQTSPNFTAEDAQAYRDAVSSHAQRKALYANPVVGPLLRKAPGGDLALAPEKVVQSIVAPGAKGGEIVRALRATAEDDPSVMTHYQTAIGLDLRRAALDPDGTVNLSRLNSWRKAHAPILSELPEVGKRLDTIRGAQQMVEAATAARIAATKEFDTKAIQAFLHGDDPGVAMRALLNGTPADASRLLSKLQASAPALAGAKQALANYLAERLLVPTAGGEGEEAARIASVRSMLRNPGQMQIVRQVLGPQAPARLRRVVQDFDAYNANSLSRINAGGSRTQPLQQIARDLAEPKTMMGRVIAQISSPLGAAVAGGITHPISDLATQAGAAMFRGWRGQQLTAATELLSRALADPKLFLELTRPVPGSASAEAGLARRARYAFANSYLNAKAAHAPKRKGQ